MGKAHPPSVAPSIHAAVHGSPMPAIHWRSAAIRGSPKPDCLMWQARLVLMWQAHLEPATVRR